MKSRKPLIVSVVVILSFVVIAGLIFVVKKRGIPFVTEREQWTIGIYTGKSPFDLKNTRVLRNPVMKAQDVTDVPAKFVADPFLIEDESTWYLFFEVYNLDSQQGDLAVATSTDTKKWKYQRIIIDEPFHLSYPYVFEWDGEYYLIPESFEANSIRLYQATEFPYKWEFIATLVDNIALVDPSIVRFDDKWWLFAADANDKHDTLRLFYSENLTDDWIEHPGSPIVNGDNHKARPSGRVLVIDGRPLRFTMDIAPTVGTHQVWAYEITDLTTTAYAEVLAKDTPIVQADGRGWNSEAMHQVDAHQIGDADWIASVDGFGQYLVFGKQY